MACLGKVQILIYVQISSFMCYMEYMTAALWFVSGPGPVFCLLLGVSSDYAQPITGQVTEVTCPVIGWAQPELTPSKRQKTGPDVDGLKQDCSNSSVLTKELLQSCTKPSMYCSRYRAEYLPEVVLPYCYLQPWEQTSVKFDSEYNHFLWKKNNTWICFFFLNDSHFVQAYMCN